MPATAFNAHQAHHALTASRRSFCAGLGTCAMALGSAASWWLPSTAQAASSALSIGFRGASYLHRWSQRDQHEFTPTAQSDLQRWEDMLTLNVHSATRSGEQLADIANRVLGNYQRHGKVLGTNSRPRTAAHEAEHFIVAVLGGGEVLEAAFARCLLQDGQGLVAVYSHRVYGKPAGPAMSDWLRAQGQASEQALMGLQGLPSPVRLSQLPRAG
jgi:hypothetical protein